MKRVGYGIVGLAMVLLGILIIVPFLKSVFPQLDGYVDYSAAVIAAAQSNNADTLKNVMLSGTDDTIKQGIDINTQALAKLTANDPNVTNLKNTIEIQKMGLNAILGDQASVDTVNKILVGAKLPPWQPPPTPVIPSATPSDVITYINANQAALNATIQLSPYSLKKTIADFNKPPVSPTNTTMIGMYTLAYAAKMGDPNAIIIVNKALTVAGLPPFKPAAAAAPADAAVAPAAAAAAVAPAAAAATTGPAPSLSVNTARPSSTLDMLKVACQSLLADASAPLK
jgi:3D (Asp-Asp-Asp) domain-containing protein